MSQLDLQHVHVPVLGRDHGFARRGAKAARGPGLAHGSTARACSQLEAVATAGRGEGGENIVMKTLAVEITVTTIRQMMGTLPQGLHAAMKVGEHRHTAGMLAARGATTQHVTATIWIAANLHRDAGDRRIAIQDESIEMWKTRAIVKEKSKDNGRCGGGKGKNGARNDGSFGNKRTSWIR